MYLLDTNIWLERLLDQERSQEVGEFLSRVYSSDIFITDFSFHSICIILIKLNKLNVLQDFVYDLFINGSVNLVHLSPEDVFEVIEVKNKFKLDFDDAYQYIASLKYELELISFDSDFDRTEKRRKTPKEILLNIGESENE